MAKQRIADLSLDLDNKWSYLKTHGDASWEQFPSYLDTVIPHFLQILEKHCIKITVFVVGQDAAIESNVTALRSIAQAGHEIGNHSFHHEPWLQRYTREQLESEFDQAEQSLAKITEQKLVGFRGPGYSLSADVLNLLHRRGYKYDCSTLPTFIGPLARAYYFLRSNLNTQQSDDRSQLFGSVRDGLRRLKPYRWKTATGPLLEIPVTTMPIVRTPFHFSYLLFLAQKSELVAELYFRKALAICWATGTVPSMLLHPLDFLGGDDVAELDFFPAMNMGGQRKRAFMDRMIGILTKKFRVVTMSQRADHLLQHSDLLPLCEMKF